MWRRDEVHPWWSSHIVYRVYVTTGAMATTVATITSTVMVTVMASLAAASSTTYIIELSPSMPMWWRWLAHTSNLMVEFEAFTVWDIGNVYIHYALSSACTYSTNVLPIDAARMWPLHFPVGDSGRRRRWCKSQRLGVGIVAGDVSDRGATPWVS